MIQINLLPKELRARKDVFEFTKEFGILVGTCIVALLAGFYLLLGSLIAGQERSLMKMRKEVIAMQSSIRELSDLKAKLTLLKNQTSLAEQILSRSILWSKKMNQISDLVQSGIWLIGLELQRKMNTIPGKKETSEEVSLVIQGRVYSRNKEETAIVGKYISALKADPDFFSSFEDVRLENIRSQQLGGISIAEFVMVCPLKAGERREK